MLRTPHTSYILLNNTVPASVLPASAILMSVGAAAKTDKSHESVSRLESLAQAKDQLRGICTSLACRQMGILLLVKPDSLLLDQGIVSGVEP